MRDHVKNSPLMHTHMYASMYCTYTRVVLSPYVAAKSKLTPLGFPTTPVGLACQRAGRRESAEEYFRLSLELDPLMWVSIQSLCELGANFDIEKHFENFAEKVGRRGGHISTGGGGGGAAVGPFRRGASRERRPPWAHYLQAPLGGRLDECGISAAAAAAWSRRDGEHPASTWAG